jgi:hypothetical protein
LLVVVIFCFFPSSLSLSAYGKTYHSTLHKSVDLFGPNYQEEHQSYNEKGQLVSKRIMRAGISVEENCYYHGKITDLFVLFRCCCCVCVSLFFSLLVVSSSVLSLLQSHPLLILVRVFVARDTISLLSAAVKAASSLSLPIFLFFVS